MTYRADDADANTAAADAATLKFIITVREPPEPEFHIEIVFDTPVPEIISAGLTRAVEYWQSAIASPSLTSARVISGKVG